MLLVEPFVCLHELENPLMEVVKHTDLQCMEEVWRWEVPHNPGNMSKLVESWVNMAQQAFGISCFSGGIPERSLYIVILLEVLLVRRDILSKFMLCTLRPTTDMPLEMM